MQRQPVDPYAGPYTSGIDVSHHNGDVDFERVAAAGYAFAIVRTGDGRDEDRRAVENLRGARAAGLRLGAYHYFRADRGGTAQAALVEAVVRRSGVSLDLPPALDLEEGARADLPGGLDDEPGDELDLDLVAHEALVHLDELERRFGRVPLVYTGQAFHWWYSQARPQLAALFARYPLWIASYRRAGHAGRPGRPLLPVDRRGRALPWPTWTLWQHTGRGVVPGVTGRCDVNRFRGDRAALEAFAG